MAPTAHDVFLKKTYDLVSGFSVLSEDQNTQLKLKSGKKKISKRKHS